MTTATLGWLSSLLCSASAAVPTAAIALEPLSVSFQMRLDSTSSKCKASSRTSCKHPALLHSVLKQAHVQALQLDTMVNTVVTDPNAAEV